MTSTLRHPDSAHLHAAVRTFVDDVVLPGVAAWDADDELPADVLDRLVALGLTGALVPRDHGGPASASPTSSRPGGRSPRAGSR
jgi:alkylation response protein AidB-like acyl-CoA dehydrogenase